MRRLYQVVWPHVYPVYTMLFILDDAQGVDSGWWWRNIHVAS